jgi:hypothetical protein
MGGGGAYQNTPSLNSESSAEALATMPVACFESFSFESKQALESRSHRTWDRKSYRKIWQAGRQLRVDSNFTTTPPLRPHCTFPLPPPQSISCKKNLFLRLRPTRRNLIDIRHNTSYSYNWERHRKSRKKNINVNIRQDR